jgi:hypothetical protein
MSLFFMIIGEDKGDRENERRKKKRKQKKQ